MPQSSLEILPNAIRLFLFTFQWGVSSVARYVKGTEPITSNGETFTAVPSLNVVFDKPMQGGAEDVPVTVTMIAAMPPFNTLILNYPHSKTTVTIEEQNYGDDASRKILFSGRISKIIGRHNKQDQIATATVVGIRARLNAPFGLQVLSTCPWPFGTENNSLCKKDVTGLIRTATINALVLFGDPYQVELTDFDTPPDFDNRLWARGYLEVDALRITIRASLGDGIFSLRRPAPPYWFGQSVIVHPGCTKTVDSCRYHNNEEHFGGAGIAMPDRNPVFEE